MSQHAATYGRWHSSMIGGGGYIQNVVLCPTDSKRVYAYVDVGGVYRSDDGGRRWRMMHANLPAQPTAHCVRSLLVDPRNEDCLLAAIGGTWEEPLGVFASKDGGVKWYQTLITPFFGNDLFRWAGVLLARNPNHPDIVLAASPDTGVWRSTDNGEKWQEFGAISVYPSDLKIDYTNPNRVWLCAQDHQTRSHNHVQSWTGGLWRSEDGGLSWQIISELAPTELLQDPVESERIYGLVDGLVHLSHDGGVTWKLWSNGLPPRLLSDTVLHPLGHTVGLLFPFQSLAAGPDFVLTASTWGDFYRLRSGKSLWERVEHQGVEEIYEDEEWFGHRLGYFGSALCSVVVDPRDHNHWFFTDWFAIYQTWDAGRRWTLTIDGIEVTVLHVLQQDSTDPSVVHLGMADNGYFRSRNGGERFEHLGWREGLMNVKCIALSPQRPNRVYMTGTQKDGGDSNQVFVSEDGGDSWRLSPMRGLPYMEQHYCNTIAVPRDHPDTAYLAVSGGIGPGRGGVYQSDDGGQSWRWIGEGLPEGDAFFAHSIWRVGRELAVGADGSMVCISHERSMVYYRDASMDCWHAAAIALREAPNCVVAAPDKPGRFFLAADGVYRSDDCGRRWQRKLDGSVAHVAVDLGREERIAAGTADGVMLSQDGGDSWSVLDRQLPNRRHNLVAFAGQRLLVGSGGSGCFWMALSGQ